MIKLGDQRLLLRTWVANKGCSVSHWAWPHPRTCSVEGGEREDRGLENKLGGREPGYLGPSKALSPQGFLMVKPYLKQWAAVRIQ